jgi:hypothetical protein
MSHVISLLCNGPFNGTTAASVMMMHLINPVPDIHEQNKSLPIAIQSVLDMAMAKNPDDRYHSVGEFAKAIQAATTGVHKKLSMHAVTAAAAKLSTNTSPPKTPLPQPRQNDTGPAQSAELNGNTPPSSPEILKNQATMPPRAEALSSKPGRVLRSFTPLPDQLQLKRVSIPQWLWVFSIVIVFALSLTVVQWFRGGFPFSLLTPTPEGSQGTASSLTLGKADKLAFLNGSNIWISNLDGSDLIQLTTDGEKKSHLHWSTEGDSVIYTSGNCLNSVSLDTKQVLTLTCFSGTTINSFDISPDGQNAAIGLGQSDLYLLPYSQLFHLNRSSRPEDLLTLAQCSYYSPYHVQDTLKAINWSLMMDRWCWSRPRMGLIGTR